MITTAVEQPDASNEVGRAVGESQGSLEVGGNRAGEHGRPACETTSERMIP